MASSNQPAIQYVSTGRDKLVGQLQKLPLIVENLHQQGVFNPNEVSEIDAIPENDNKTRKILDWVLNKGEEACYQFLRILDRERKSVFPKADSSVQAADLHTWISLSPLTEEPEDDYISGPNSCHQLQNILKTRTKDILGEQWKRRQRSYGVEVQEKFTFIPLGLDTDAEENTLRNKILLKSKKAKKPRSKKMKAYIPKDTQRKSPEDLLNSREQNILIVGKPGIGKTTVVQQMLHHWAERQDRKLDFMFYFDENTLSNTSAIVSLKNLLGTFFMSIPQLKDNADEIVQYLHEYSEKVTIVFDGIRDFQDKAILLEIMDPKPELLPEAKIVVTCRPEVEYEFSDWSKCTVYVQGFSEESIYDFFRTMSDDPELVDSVINNPALFSMCHVPMYAFMVAACISYYTSDEAQKPCTATELYVRIFRHCLQRHGNVSLLQLDRHIKNSRDMVFSLAESAFSATKLKSINLKFDYDERGIAGVFLKSVSDMSPGFAKTFCAFLHNTMQDFFSALWLLDKTELLDEVLQLCQNEETQHMKHVIPFLCGLQSHTIFPLLECLLPLNKVKENIDGFFEKVLNTFLCLQPDNENMEITFICQCLYEYQSPETCCSFLERINHLLDLSGDCLDPYTCCAVSYVISQSGNKQVHLHLEESAVSLSGLKTILKKPQYLRDLSTTLCQVWTMFLKQKQMDSLIQLLQLQKNKIHLLVSSENDVLEQAGKIIMQSAQEISLYLHCDKDPPQLTHVLFSWLPHIGSFQIVAKQEEKEQENMYTTLLMDLCLHAALHQPQHLQQTVQKVMTYQKIHYISQLSCEFKQGDKERERRCRTFLLDLCLQAALHQPQHIQQVMQKVTSYIKEDGTEEYFYKRESDFLLDLFSRVKQYESETDRSVLPVLLPVYQSGPPVWNINLSERKVSLLLEVLKLHTEKKPVVLRDCSDEESEVRNFLQCLPYISELRVNRKSNRARTESVRQSRDPGKRTSSIPAPSDSRYMAEGSGSNRLDFSCNTGLDLSTKNQDCTLNLSTEDCRDISTAILNSHRLTELILEDCEVEDTGVDMFFLILHTVRLRCSKALLLRFLSHLHVVNESDCSRRIRSLSHALDGQMDLSETPLDHQACRSLALFLEYCEGLSELDLSHCQLSDHDLELLLPHLHKAAVLDLSHNAIDDRLAGRIYTVVSTNSNIQTVRLFNNRITDKQPFQTDKRFEIW